MQRELSPAMLEDTPSTPHLFGPFNVCLLVLMGGSPSSRTALCVERTIKRIVEQHCAASGTTPQPYAVYSAFIAQDRQIEPLLMQLNPTVVVTVGQYWTRLLFAPSPSFVSATCHESLNLLVDIKRLHGQLLPAHKSWGNRSVCPIEACDTDADESSTSDDLERLFRALSVSTMGEGSPPIPLSPTEPPSRVIDAQPKPATTTSAHSTRPYWPQAHLSVGTFLQQLVLSNV